MIKNLYTEDFFTKSVWSGGSTTELFLLPEAGSYASRNFYARISSASVDLPRSEFTNLPNVKRFITPLNGKLSLTHDEKKFIELEPFCIYEFDGGIPTVSCGTVEDFNLMLKDGTQGFMKAAPLNGNFLIETDCNSFIWFFSYKSLIKIFTDGTESLIKPFSLLVLSGFERSKNIQIKTDKLQSCSSACNLSETGQTEEKLIYGKISLP